MYKLGIGVSLLLVLLVAASGYYFISNTASKQSIANENSIIESPTLPEQYVAKSPYTGNQNQVQPLVTKEPEKPVLESAAQIHINGTGLSINETNAQIVSYLTIDQNYTNQTIVTSEINFWNGIAKMIQTKMDFTNPITIAYAQKTVRLMDSGAYSVNQTCDIWDYTMSNWTTFVDNNATTWDEDINFASYTISNGLKGDCDDFAVVLASANIALGGNSRTVYAVNPTKSDEAHMYAEAQFNNTSFVPIIQSRYLLPNTSPIHFHPGNWLYLDWFNYPATATYPGGNFYPDGGKIWVMYKEGNWEKLEKSGSNWAVILNGPV